MPRLTSSLLTQQPLDFLPERLPRLPLGLGEVGQRRREADPGQGVVEVGVAQGDGQEDDAPQPLDGEVVAAAGGAEALEELLVGDGVAEVLDGLEAGEVLQPAPGEEGLAAVERLQGAGPSR